MKSCTNYAKPPHSLTELKNLDGKCLDISLSQIYTDLNLLKLVDIYYLNLAVFAYSTFGERTPDAFENYLSARSVPPVHNTRSQQSETDSEHFIYTLPRLQKTMTSVRYAAMALWNKLPHETKQSSSLAVFKSRVKSWLTESYVTHDIKNEDE